MSRIPVLIVDDDLIFLSIVERLMLVEARLQVVGRASTGLQALELADHLRPHLIVMDLAMPVMNGLEATRRLRARPDSPPILIITAHHDEEYLEAALQAGAVGLVSKSNLDGSLIDRIRLILPGLSETESRELAES